jgi:DNA-binding LacI/PurR family transcriptional regulator
MRGLPSVAPSTREKVEAVAAELGYVPDPYAARLSSANSHTVIVAVPYTGQWYYAQIVSSVEAVATAAGYDIRLHVAGDDDQRHHLIEDVLPQARRVDGAILVDLPVGEEEVDSLRRRNLEMVAVGQHVEGVVTVRVDNFRAAHDATSHLVECGHRRIGLLGGMPERRSQLSIPGEREAGFRGALVERGIEVDETLIRNGNFSIAGGLDATNELLSFEEPPTAIFALSDEMAAGAIQAAREAAVTVPDELAVVGFDDHEFAEAMGITTVRQPVGEQGEAAMQALLDAFNGEPWSEDRVLDYELIERQTTARVNTG